MDGWREYEADWFTAMQGVPLEISDPALPGSQNEESQFTVSESSFERKIVTLETEGGGRTEVKMFQGTLDVAETWRSAWRRQASGVLNMGFKYLLLPAVSAIVGGLFVWWLTRPENSNSPNSVISKSPAGYQVPEGTADSTGEPTPENPDATLGN